MSKVKAIYEQGKLVGGQFSIKPPKYKAIAIDITNIDTPIMPQAVVLYKIDDFELRFTVETAVGEYFPQVSTEVELEYLAKLIEQKLLFSSLFD